MLFDPTRHEPLAAIGWDEARARAAIEAIVRDSEARYRRETLWPIHPHDLEPGDDPTAALTSLYDGAIGVAWALRDLHMRGVASTRFRWSEELDHLREAHRARLAANKLDEPGSYLIGELPLELLAYADEPSRQRADVLEALLDTTLDHPARELMWGSPGALLVASFLHEHDGDERWAAAFRRIAAKLHGELRWSDEHRCHYWQQDLYGHHSSHLDAVHGFVATARALIHGRRLLPQGAWPEWHRIIVETIDRTATREAGQASWRVELIEPPERVQKKLMQFCHGAPGFVICLAKLPGSALDTLLIEAGEAVWAAGPLAKGANLCHGTAGNGYAFLALFERTGDPRWLERARRFGMHAIAQSDAEAASLGRRRHSLWTGDPGLAIYLDDCMRGRCEFPTLDRFFEH